MISKFITLGNSRIHCYVYNKTGKSREKLTKFLFFNISIFVYLSSIITWQILNATIAYTQFNGSDGIVWDFVYKTFGWKSGEDRARSDCTYVQVDLDLYFLHNKSMLSYNRIWVKAIFLFHQYGSVLSW